ncbi:MAG: aspartate kinase [Eubacterium sp.]|jgi:aspartate kinase|nr:aspartate kinase [Eubacterium sp.]
MGTKIFTFEGISIVTFTNIPPIDWSKFAANIFERVADAGINIDMITQSPGMTGNLSLGFTFEDADIPKLLTVVNEITQYKKNPPMVNVGNVKIIIKSTEMEDSVGFAKKVFGALYKIDCIPLLITTALDEISLLVHESARSDLESELAKDFGADSFEGFYFGADSYY